VKELLELSKLNCDNTLFDNGDPISVRRAAWRYPQARRAERNVQSRFRYFT